MENVADGPRKIVWLVDSLDAVRQFPAVREKIGFALYQAQVGGQHESARPMHGFDIPVHEIRADGPGGTYPAMYTVHLADQMYVLHAFQKKSKSGAATRRADINLIRKRLKLAQDLAEGRNH